MDRRTADIRLWIYEHFRDTGRAPSPDEIGASFGLTPLQTDSVLRELHDEWDAIVLLPGSPYLWMAEPFSAIPTNFPFDSGNRRWYGNCLWDTLAVAALLDIDGHLDTHCPASGSPLRLVVRAGELVGEQGVAHFAVPASEWWRSIGYT